MHSCVLQIYRLCVTTEKSLVYIYSNLQYHFERIEVPLGKCVSSEHEYKMYKLLCDV
jgi:hypothetical protein